MSSFKAELRINNEVRTILNTSQSFSQFADTSGNPTTKPVGNTLELLIESTKNDSFFYENMFSPTA